MYRAFWNRFSWWAVGWTCREVRWFGFVRMAFSSSRVAGHEGYHENSPDPSMSGCTHHVNRTRWTCPYPLPVPVPVTRTRYPYPSVVPVHVNVGRTR